VNPWNNVGRSSYLFPFIKVTSSNYHNYSKGAFMSIFCAIFHQTAWSEYDNLLARNSVASGLKEGLSGTIFERIDAAFPEGRSRNCLILAKIFGLPLGNPFNSNRG
jgi:hypothetical protein